MADPDRPRRLSPAAQRRANRAREARGATPQRIVRPKKDRMWPLDASIAALAGLILYMIVTQLSIHDKDWTRNAITYMIGVPVMALLMALVLRTFASKYVQKSIQIGFLFSVSLHLLLLILATGVIIFSRYYPQSVMGLKPERSPIKRTVPEYLFKTAETRDAQPDWSKPTEAETASPVVPREQRQLPPVQESAPRLEMPQPQQPIQRPDRPRLQRRDVATESVPQPSDSPAKLARQMKMAEASLSQELSSPVAPEVPLQQEVQLETPDRSVAEQNRSQSTAAASLAPKPVELPQLDATAQPLAGQRRSARELPQIGELGISRPQRRVARQQTAQPVGAAPAPRSVAIAREVESSDRMLAPLANSPERLGKTTGAQLTLGESPAVSTRPSRSSESSGIGVLSNSIAAAPGMPRIDPGRGLRRPGRSRVTDLGQGLMPAGTPTLDSIVAANAAAAPSDDAARLADAMSERLDRLASSELSRSRSATAPSIRPDSGMSGPILDIPLAEGPIGLGEFPARIAGVFPSDQQPRIASLDLTNGSRPRRDVGGPVTPFGTKIAAVESFSRRVMRTEGGMAPTPPGLVGPATEEAIERGLAYLDSIQNDDGSWSLQGHGTNVVIQGDTAATGLCLLAFQGAGYTHKQHQYADTVGKGIQFLVDNQRTNGDLYRRENPLSDRNVAFYSHGIAALAMSEAYGMTQDPELREPAQMALNYIAGTQHRTRGGWRYTPQISADTSVTGWMMMALKSGQLSGLEVPQQTYDGIDRWLNLAQEGPDRRDRYRYNPYAPDTPTQRHGRIPTPTMTAVGMLMRMYSGWRRDTPAMRSAAEYLLQYPPQMGTRTSPQRDAYYWYYATQVMFHMGDRYWERWNDSLNPVLLDSQLDNGPYTGSWDPVAPVPDRWSVHAGRLYVTTMNLLNLEVYYRHLPIYEDTAE